MRGFSDIPIDRLALGIDPSPKAAKSFVAETTHQLLSTFDRSIERWRLSPQEVRFLDAMVGRHRNDRSLLASNLMLRRQLASRLIDLLHEMEATAPSRRFYLVTPLSDRWLSFDRFTQIWLGGMTHAVRQIMRLGKFTGWFGLIELQTLDETVQFFGRLLLPHGHFIAWSDDPEFDPEEAEARMAASRRLESGTGAATVTVRSDPRLSPCNMGAYIMKGAALAKRRAPNSRSPVGFVLDECALPPVSAVRQMEILSQITFDELMLSGGNGGQLRSELVRLMKQIPPRNSEIDREHAARFWVKCRRRTRRTTYQPVSINRTRAQLLPDPPISLALARSQRAEWIIPWLLLSGQAIAPRLPEWLAELICSLEPVATIEHEHRKLELMVDESLSADPLLDKMSNRCGDARPTMERSGTECHSTFPW